MRGPPWCCPAQCQGRRRRGITCQNAVVQEKGCKNRQRSGKMSQSDCEAGGGWVDCKGEQCGPQWISLLYPSGSVDDPVSYHARRWILAAQVTSTEL